MNTIVLRSTKSDELGKKFPLRDMNLFSERARVEKQRRTKKFKRENRI